jgi:hypothetical protein
MVGSLLLRSKLRILFGRWKLGMHYTLHIRYYILSVWLVLTLSIDPHPAPLVPSSSPPVPFDL